MAPYQVILCFYFQLTTVQRSENFHEIVSWAVISWFPRYEPMLKDNEPPESVHGSKQMHLIFKGGTETLYAKTKKI